MGNTNIACISYLDDRQRAVLVFEVVTSTLKVSYDLETGLYNGLTRYDSPRFTHDARPRRDEQSAFDNINTIREVTDND